jgi:tetratricopeptide (TPR) repeat protein
VETEGLYARGVSAPALPAAAVIVELNVLWRATLDRIAKRRRPVLTLIRNAQRRPADDKRLDVHATIDEALSLFEKGRLKDKLKAEASLLVLLQELRDIERISGERLELARKQAATVYLVAGSIAASRLDPKSAIDAFKKVLRLNEHDCDAIKYLGEQLLCWAQTEDDAQHIHINDALQRFQQLEQLAGKSEDASLTTIDALRLQGRAHLRLGATGKAKSILERVTSQADAMHEHRRLLGEVHELHGDACRAQTFWPMASTSYDKSKSYYRQLDDNSAVARIDLKIEKNNRHVTEVSVDEEPRLYPRPQCDKARDRKHPRSSCRFEPLRRFWDSGAGHPQEF